jgi:hypothetical protein
MSPKDKSKKVEDIDQAFAEELADEVDAKVVPDETEEKIPEPAEEIEVEAPVETEEPELKPETPEKSYKDYGAPELEGKTPEQVARYVRDQTDYWAMRNRVFGEQANELGELRKFKKEHGEPKPKVEDPFSEMSEGQIADFNRQWEKNPSKAIVDAGMGNYIKQQITLGVQEAWGSDAVKQTFAEQQNMLAFESFVSRTPDCEEYIPLMQTLDGPNYLGPQGRKYDELYAVAKLGNSDDPSYGGVYRLMKKHPSMSYSDAHKFAKSLLSSSEESQALKVKVEKDVQDIDTIRAKPTGVKASKKSEDYKNMTTGQAFESVAEEEKI